jgi:hypothetical protein
MFPDGRLSGARGIGLAVDLRWLSRRAVLVVVHLTNGGTSRTSINVSVVGGGLGGVCGHSMRGLGYSGFVALCGDSCVEFVLANSPLVRASPASWFCGSDAMCDGEFRDVSGCTLSGVGNDCGFGWSWAAQWVESGAKVILTTIIRLESSGVQSPRLTIEGIENDVVVTAGDWLALSCSVEVDEIGAMVTIWFLFDEDCETLDRIFKDFIGGMPFIVGIDLKAVKVGPHRISIYAADVEGSVSAGVSFRVVVGNSSVRSSLHVMGVRGGNRHHSATALGPATFFPLSFGAADDGNFKLSGHDGDRTFRLLAGGALSFGTLVIPSGDGINCRIRLKGGAALAAATWGQSATVGTVTMTTHVQSIAPCAIFVCFKLSNAASTQATVEVECDSFAYINSSLSSRCLYVDNSRGFSAETETQTHRLTFLCSNYPLVSDVSSYWFGKVSVETNYWAPHILAMTRVKRELHGHGKDVRCQETVSLRSG